MKLSTRYPMTGADSVWSGSNDFTSLQWSRDGEFQKLFTGHKGGVRCAQSIGMHLWTGSDDKTLRVWDLDTAETISILKGDFPLYMG